MRALCTLLTASCIAASIVPAAHAEKFFGSSSASVLYGEDYHVVPEEMVTFTFENASGHNWGDTFFFVDRHQGKGDGDGYRDTYGEFSPRLSLGWLTGSDLSFGPVKDVLLAYTYEFSLNGYVAGNAPTNGFDNHLGGIGLSWELPGFRYFNTNVYYADNGEIEDDYLLSVSWGLPFTLGSVAFLFDGYTDYSSSASDHKAELHFNPQLKLDIGNFVGNPGMLYAGVEYSYWYNKFGLDQDLAFVDGEQNMVSALIKFHF